jgi:hypothetical protein
VISIVAEVGAAFDLLGQQVAQKTQGGGHKPRKRGKAGSCQDPWEAWGAPDDIDQVVRTFVRANVLNPGIVLKLLDTQIELDLYGEKLESE